MNAQPDEVLYSREQGGPRVEILGPYVERSDEVLTPLALQLLASLHRRFNGRRLELLAARERRQAEFDAGVLPDFLARDRRGACRRLEYCVRSRLIWRTGVSRSSARSTGKR